MIVGRKWYCMRHFLGEQMLSESWAVEDDEKSMAWLAEFKRAALAQWHPETRLEVTHFTEGATEVFRPENPGTLEEVLGPT